MFAAGYLEGHLSQKAIYDGFQNIYSQFFTLGKPPPAKILAWVGAHMEWVEAQVIRSRIRRRAGRKPGNIILIWKSWINFRTVYISFYISKFC